MLADGACHIAATGEPGRESREGSQHTRVSCEHRKLVWYLLLYDPDPPLVLTLNAATPLMQAHVRSSMSTHLTEEAAVSTLWRSTLPADARAAVPAAT